MWKISTTSCKDRNTFTEEIGKIFSFLFYRRRRFIVAADAKQLCMTAEKGIILLSAGLQSDTPAEINRTIIAGKRLAGPVKMLVFGIHAGMFSWSLKAAFWFILA